MEISRTGLITLAGRPNVGKSTLINRIVGEKVAIVTNKPQTTRSRIFGVWNGDGVQLVFADTPGFHASRSRLDDYMVKVAGESVDGVDAVALLVEPIDNVGAPEKALLERVARSKTPAVLVINKCDTVKKEELLPVIERYSAAYAFDAIVPVSAKTGDGVTELLELLKKYAPEGEAMFPEDVYTDQPVRQMIAEIVREKLLLCLDQEVPHGAAVELTRYVEREDGVLELEATIYCEKAAHKGMIIGKGGAMLRRVGELARRDIERLMDTRVYLQTWVKVKENWRNSDAQLRNFGYRE